MIGVLVNTIAIIFGGLFGSIVKKGIPKHIADAIMGALGLCVLYIGITGISEGERTLAMICAMVIGTALGTLINIDGQINRLGDMLSNRLKGVGNITQGFSAGSILFCIGAMAIVGSFNAGLKGDNEMLFTKSLLDMVSSIMLSVSYGIGIAFSSVSVFIYQGAFVLLAHLISPYLSADIINEITCTGSLIIVALSLNLLGITKIKVANMLPAIFLVPLLCAVSFL